MNGKIARLPSAIRKELNRRLESGSQNPDLRKWLNSLPEVKSLLAAEFGGQPITKQNIYEWTQHGFRQWKIRQRVAEFLAAQETDTPQPASGPDLTDKLVRWLAFRYAAAAHTLAPADNDPDAELRHLRGFAIDILALRHGDQKAKRLELDQQRLALEQAEDQALKEEEFWAWTKQPDIRAQLDADYKKSNLWNDAIRTMVPRLFTPEPQPDETAGNQSSAISDPPCDETADPAILI